MVPNIRAKVSVGRSLDKQSVVQSYRGELLSTNSTEILARVPARMDLKNCFVTEALPMLFPSPSPPPHQ